MKKGVEHVRAACVRCDGGSVLDRHHSGVAQSLVLSRADLRRERSSHGQSEDTRDAGREVDGQREALINQRKVRERGRYTERHADIEHCS